MLPLLSCKGLSKAFGAQTLFSNITMNLHSGDRAGLIGPNGSGKSTLLKIFCGLAECDSGDIFSPKHTRLSYVAQEDIFNEELNCVDNLYLAVKDLDIEQADQYNRIYTVLSRANFDDQTSPVEKLSGGWRKRLAICRALVVYPDVLVMDEPTNHLDIEGIIWLEKLLRANLPESPAAMLMVSHDRRFLENTVNRIIELGPVYPEGSLEATGTYADFLEKKSAFLDQQLHTEERLANKVRRETEWLRRGPKARSTKAKYRIDEAGRLQGELNNVRSRNRSTGSVAIQFDATHRKTKKLLTCDNISKQFTESPLFKNLNLVLSPGSRLGILGRNGTGKSTLMQILAAATESDGPKPDSGTVTTAENVRIVSFDQRREQLDKSITLRRALAPDGDSVVYQDRSIHVVSWAKRFLFRPDQLDTPVHRLSGGEQARILIARLMLKPADILLLDEPTNDLDIPSLDVLEESLAEFPGALVLVSHDRFMLDQVCNTILGFNGIGGTSFFADYEQWLADLLLIQKGTEVKSAPEPRSKKSSKSKAAKLSYMAQREYDQMEDEINRREERIEKLQSLMVSPEAVADPQLLQDYWNEQEQLQNETGKLYARWEELEELKLK